QAALPVPVAVLDACVLFQGRLTNLLPHLAEAKAFEPIWSDDIHAEWMRNLHSSMGIPIDNIEYGRGEMERGFPAANVPAPPTLVATIQGVSKTAAQRKDAHVVATAVIAKAAVIVTHNIKDFSPEVLSRYGLAKVRPDAFCVGLLASHETRVLAGIRDAPGQPQEDADVANSVHLPSRRRPTGHAQVGSRIGITRPGRAIGGGYITGSMIRVDGGRIRGMVQSAIAVGGNTRRRGSRARTRGDGAFTVYGRPGN